MWLALHYPTSYDHTRHIFPQYPLCLLHLYQTKQLEASQTPFALSYVQGFAHAMSSYQVK